MTFKALEIGVALHLPLVWPREKRRAPAFVEQDGGFQGRQRVQLFPQG